MNGGTIIAMKRKPTRRALPIRDVIVQVKLLYASGRSVLSGILGYLAEGHPWRIRLLQTSDELTESVVQQAEESGVDGMIITLPGTSGAMARLAKSSIPTVFMNVDDEALRRRGNAAFLLSDNAAIGRECARHLLSCGKFASFAYIHMTAEVADWSQARADAFRKTLAPTGRPFAEYAARNTVGDDADNRDLTDFLVSLPKPAGVMAAFDARAAHVLNVCSSAKLAVPRQIAVIGVDNDEFIDNYSAPSLSSVLPDFGGGGRRAAELLEDLMAGRGGQTPRETHIPVKKVVVRESTRHLPPATTLVENALAFIQAQVSEGVTPSEVVRHLGVSRRLAELRFQELRGETIRATIEKERLDRVKRLLRMSSRPIGRIAEETGFKSVDRLSRLFKQRTGLSPLQWRKQQRSNG